MQTVPSRRRIGMMKLRVFLGCIEKCSGQTMAHVREGGGEKEGQLAGGCEVHLCRRGAIGKTNKHKQNEGRLQASFVIPGGSPNTKCFICKNISSCLFFLKPSVNYTFQMILMTILNQILQKMSYYFNFTVSIKRYILSLM